MIEVKVPVDFSAIQVKGRFGFTHKLKIYAGFAAAIIIPLNIWGERIFHQEVVYFLTIIIAMIVLMPNVMEKGGKLGISGEERVLNYLHFTANKQMRPYEDICPIAQLDDERQTIKRVEQKNQKSRK